MKKFKIPAAVMCCVLFLTACRNQEPAGQTSEPPIVSISAESSSSSEASSEAVSSSTSEFSDVSPSMPEITPECSGYALYCVEDNRMIYSVNADAAIAPASLTKLLTASVALRYISPDEVFTVGTEQELVQPESSVCFIEPGQRLKMYDLLTGMLLPSGNDAAYTVAVSTARKVSGNAGMSDRQAVKYFCLLMNDLARELGMNGSHFADPDGWDDDEHYTTVSDLVKLAKYALSVPEIREIVSTPQKYVVFESGECITWFNGNKLLHPECEYYCENAIGMKTGFTDNAGLCLIAAFVKGGKTYITVIVGCEDDRVRYETTLALFEAINE